MVLKSTFSQRVQFSTLFKLFYNEVDALTSTTLYETLNYCTGKLFQWVNAIQEWKLGNLLSFAF